MPFSNEDGAEVNSAHGPETTIIPLLPPRPRPIQFVAEAIYHEDEIHELKIWTSRLVGKSGLTVVFKADMVSPYGVVQPVTVKTLLLLPLYEDLHELMEREMRYWSSLKDARILPLYGVCTVGIQRVGLVSPLMSNGNMKNFLLKNPEKDRLRLLEQVAEGLEYLHLTARVVHGDLKCSNILISANECALIADFGLSTSIKRTCPTPTNIRILNTAGFAAPELFNDQAFSEIVDSLTSQKPRSKTTFSDVFAFGSLIYEAYACEEPWHAVAAFAVIYKVVQKEEMPPRKVANPNPSARPLDDVLWELCTKCWNKDPYQRPDCVQVRRDLLMERSQRRHDT